MVFTDEHLDGVLRLCVAEGWPSFPEDPERAIRVLKAPGVTTAIALDQGKVVGFAQLFSDGELQAFLANLAVDERSRGQGIGRALVTEVLRLAGGERIDLLSEDQAVAFYESFPNFRKPGFRLYPRHNEERRSDGPQIDVGIPLDIRGMTGKAYPAAFAPQPSWAALLKRAADRDRTGMISLEG